jgi:hypothetical protein
LLALPQEFLLPATIAEQTRARSSVDTLLNTPLLNTLLPPPIATSGLHILVDAVLALLNISLSVPAGIRSEVARPSTSSDGTLPDTDNVSTNQQ